MQLKSLKLTNFNGFKEKVIEFPSKLTAIFGENGAGKSTILQGIELAINGSIYNPLTGKQADMLDYFGFHDDKFTVELTVTNPDMVEITITREFVRSVSSKGAKVTQNASILPVPESMQNDNIGVTTVNTFCAGLFGNVHHFDFQTFFTLSPAKQFETLASVLSLNMTPEILEEEIFYYLDEANIANQVDISLHIHKSQKDLALLNSAVASAERVEKLHRDTVDSMKKTVRSLQEIKDQFQKVNETIQDLEARKKKTVEGKEQAQRDLSVFEQAEQKKTTAKLQLEQLDFDIKRIDDQMNNSIHRDYEREIVDAQKSISTLAEYRAGKRNQLAGLEKQLQDIKEKMKHLHSQFSDMTINQAVVDFRNELMNALEESGKCPICERDFENGDRAVAVSNLDFNSSDVRNDISDKLKELEKEEMNTNTGIRVLRDEINDVTIEINSFESRIANSRDGLAHQEVIKKQNDQLLKESNLRKATCNETIKSAIEIMSGIDYAKSRDLVAISNQQIAEFDIKLKDAYQMNGVLKAQETAAQTYQANKERLEVAQTVKKIIKTIKANCIEKAFGDITAGISRNFRMISKDRWYAVVKFTDDRGNQVFNLGLRPMTQSTPLEEFVPFHKVNKGHQMRLLFAFLLSLPADNSFRILLLDEAEKISEGYEYEFIDGLEKLSDDFDNVVICTSRKYQHGGGTWLSLD